MHSQSETENPLFHPFKLPCGVILKNRIAKSAMSDSLGDGRGHPSLAQCRLYQRWAQGGLGLSIVGEVQGSADFAEKPGNLVLDGASDPVPFRRLASKGASNGAQLWLQLGHAGAMAHPPISQLPMGPSAIDIAGLSCAQMTRSDIEALPAEFARTAMLAKDCGFGGVQIHAAHGFLLSQFLSPLFNRRQDDYGGSIEARMRLVFKVFDAVRAAVGPAFPIAIKLNATDQLEGGLSEAEALAVVDALNKTSIDLIDVSGGTYFPGAKSASDSAGRGPYFLDFARKARRITGKPLMATGGFKTMEQASDAVAGGHVDLVGLARAFALQPDLANLWQEGRATSPTFPTFSNPPEGGITAWYTMRLTEIGEDRELGDSGGLAGAIKAYEARDEARSKIWNRHFKPRS